MQNTRMLNIEVQTMYDARKHICFNLGRVMQRVYGYYEQRLSPFGLTPPQYFVFNALRMGDGISLGTLGECISINGSTLTGIIDRIEKIDYVERRPNPGHRSSVLVFLTDKGLPPILDGVTLTPELNENTILSRLSNMVVD